MYLEMGVSGGMWAELRPHPHSSEAFELQFFSDESFAITSSRLKLAGFLTDREFLETVEPLSWSKAFEEFWILWDNPDSPAPPLH
jgi:hypothetical protein